MCSGSDLLCQLSREICSLMGVVPSDVLPKRRLEKKSADLEDLRLGGVVEASHEPVAHYEVDRALKRDRFFGHFGLFAIQYVLTMKHLDV